MTPEEKHVDETFSTLKFAESSKNVTPNAKHNEVIDYRAKYREACTEVSILCERLVALEKEMDALRTAPVAFQPSSFRYVFLSEGHRSSLATFVAMSSVTSLQSSPGASMTAASPVNADADDDYSIEQVNANDVEVESGADS